MLKHLFLTDYPDSSRSTSSSVEESSSESKCACGDSCSNSVEVDDDYSVTKGTCCSYCNTGKYSLTSSSSSSDFDSDDLGKLLDYIFK